MTSTEYPNGGHYDVLIMGGGPSGSHAAVAAARAGYKVLLVEKHGFLGGSLTAMGVGPMMSFHNADGEQMVKGQPEELVERLIARDASPGHIEDSITYCKTVTPFASEVLKVELESMILEAGGELLYHSHFAGAETGTDGQIAALIICNKAGLRRYSARVYIDATGDGDLSAALGVQFAKGRPEDQAMQPMTMNLCVGNVDMEAVRRDVFEHPENFEFDLGREEGLRRLRTTPRVSLKAYINTWREAKARGEVDVPREFVLFFETATPGMVIVNTSRIQGLDGTNPHDLSKAEVIGRRQNLQIFSFLKKHCRGFENAIHLSGASQIGVRETRRVEGLYTLTGSDILEGTAFPDPIAMGGYPIDIHSPDKAETTTFGMGKSVRYEIPMRCLLVQHPSNLIVAGRCISASNEAMAAIRVSPIAMAIGQAAGTIASVALDLKVAPNEVPYESVRKKLDNAGVKLPAADQLGSEKH